MEKYDVKSPTTGNTLTEPTEFNLMFDTQIGPSNLVKGFVSLKNHQFPAFGLKREMQIFNFISRF